MNLREDHDHDVRPEVPWLRGLGGAVHRLPTARQALPVAMTRPGWLPPIATPAERAVFRQTGGLLGQPYDCLMMIALVLLLFVGGHLLFGA